MSELKSVKQSDVMWGHWFTEYYLKTEADKVIAKLEAENTQLKKEIAFMHSNCKWNAGDACARLLGEKLALIDENVKLKQEAK